MNQRFDLEQLYFQAKESYYLGEPIMSDDEFDRMEQELINLGSTAPFIVGADDRKAKYSHPSPMLSLGKLQAAADGTPPTESANKWMVNTGAKKFEATPKFDGNAANVIYANGKLIQILSRGNGTKGRDITDKVKHNVPATIILSGTVEIRGEVCIKKSTFNQKYANEFRNPRNYVAGVLNRDDNSDTTISELDFLPVEVRQQIDGDATYLQPTDIKGLKFAAHSIYIDLADSINNFEFAYSSMKTYREEISEYPLDGFVIKAPIDFRYKLGENSHDPNWAIAIKFPPKEAITKIVDISWQWGKTGRVTPVAIMEPVDLDGSTVSRASLFNLGFIKGSGAMVGATVAIAKAGDIIPQILRVITPAPNTVLDHPTDCKCGAKLEVQEVHLICVNPDCSAKAQNKFHTGVNVLGLDGVGGAMINSIWEAGFRNPLDLLDPTKFNKEILIFNGVKNSKTLDNMFKEIAKIKDIHPMKLILCMGIDGMGHTVAKQLENYLTGLPHSFHGLQKDVIAGFEPFGSKRLQYNAIVAAVSKYVNIILPEQVAADSIPFEMSGSPKTAGFKTKDEFVAAAKEKGYHHVGMSSAKVLFVEDLNNLSNKIKTAQSKGVKILQYSDISV